MIIDKLHISLFNILNELIYIYDYNTLDILFLNNTAKNILKINNNIPLKKDILNCSFFNNRQVLSRDITEEPKFISYEGNNFSINKTHSIYNHKKAVLCICNELKDLELHKYQKPLDMKDVLINSVSLLSKEDELFKIMYEILEIIGLYYNADKCYINEYLTNSENKVYCYEWNRIKYENSMYYEINNKEDIYKWSKIVVDKELLFIEDINFIKKIWPEKYEDLKIKKINNVFICIMNFLNKPIGFLCIENIEIHKSEVLLLKSLVYFIVNEFNRRQMSKKLTFMSFHDEATGLNNKNKYLNYIENIKYTNLKFIGVAFIDINGLKIINDTQGHEFGDKAIKEVSEALKRYFRKEDIYRVGGDEFVIISENISKDTFFQKINSINRHFLDLMEYSISIGYLWEDKNIEINTLTNLADEYMYQAKKAYYEYIKAKNVEIFSAMATKSLEDSNKIKITLGYDTELDFNANKFSFQSKQDIFKFKVKQLINNNSKTYMLVMLDINDFKLINEMYGFDEGNNILLKINHIINKHIFGKGICFHSYSDVYYFCCEASDDNEILKLLYNINNDLNENILNIKIVLSYGIYRIYDKDKVIDIDEILKRVSYAHKISKKDKTKNITFYDDILKINMLNEKQIENDMEDALNNKNFKLYLQPKYNIYNSNIVGAEALVRWQHPQKGLMLPYKFINIFEKNGFIMKLDMYILEEVCKFLKINEKIGRENIPISVNISKLNFRRKNLKEDIMKIINQYNINPKLIELEITESLIAEEPEQIIKTIQDLKNENLTISMDDFGTGYSCLNMLQKLPVDVLKIDCGFFKKFEKSKKGAAIIKSIVMLAKELNLDIVAEGVENKEEVEYLKEIGCNNIQGYYFCKPIPLEEFEEIAFKNNNT
ncbi:EAL domain-containing protein [[Clostridium] colinum]|uniref:EAL domain-containing protein n=1 Tax=[Clostridium] colinum TaxID=36835 RepID=UPI002025B445|nr:EAL domain-containing protein [[Clostridium] colinum]